MRPADRHDQRRNPAVDLGWLLALCDRGIAGCRLRDAVEVGDVFMDLTATLDFEYRQAALGLAALYARCLLAVKRQQFALPRLVLEELRAACLAAPMRGRPGRR